ncbi:MAG: DUF1674 domain-containing protein [Hyphomicrobiales bacterium]
MTTSTVGSISIAEQAPAEPKTDDRVARRRLEVASRALAEAAVRRTQADGRDAMAQGERGGRGGLDPVRYGDWEVKGIATDF